MHTQNEKRGVRFWVHTPKGPVKVTLRRGRAIHFQSRETTSHGATLVETNSIAHDGDRLMWSWCRIEINTRRIESWQGAFECVIDKEFNPRNPGWDVAIAGYNSQNPVH